MPNINYSFTTPANYIYDSYAIEVVGGTAQLISDPTYPVDNPTIIPTASITQDALDSFLATLTAAGLDEVRFVLRVDGQDKYYDTGGSAWRDADGTYSQTNDLATLQANLATFTDRGDLVPVIYLHSDDGSTTPNIDDLTIAFNSYGGSATTENLCTVFGFIYDEINSPVEGVNVTVSPNRFGHTGDKLINKDATTVVTDSTGYWEITLIETATDNDNWSYKFDIGGYVESKFIPNLVSVQFNDLTNAIGLTG